MKLLFIVAMVIGLIAIPYIITVGFVALGICAYNGLVVDDIHTNVWLVGLIVFLLGAFLRAVVTALQFLHQRGRFRRCHRILCVRIRLEKSGFRSCR